MHNSEKNCKEFITDMMLIKDINCFKKSEKNEIGHYTVKMQNLQSLYYFNIENELQKPLKKMKVKLNIYVGNYLFIERNFHPD